MKACLVFPGRGLWADPCDFESMSGKRKEKINSRTPNGVQIEKKKKGIHERSVAYKSKKKKNKIHERLMAYKSRKKEKRNSRTPNGVEIEKRKKKGIHERPMAYKSKKKEKMKFTNAQ